MEIIRAKVLGYCMGVKRAVEAAADALQKNSGAQVPVFTLGPLIHNPTVLDSLEKRGLHVLNPQNIDSLKSPSVVVIRAHGTTPQVLEQLESCGASVVDATCPRVHLSQKRAAEWSSRGYRVIIAGDRNHGEVTSISGYSNGNATVIQDSSEAKSLEVPEKAILIAQTTFSPIVFQEISDVLSKKNPQLKIFNSICSATMERQDALKALNGTVEGIVVIGGKNSANTRRLYESALGMTKACLIENASEIPSEFFGLNSVGITAGASTPDEVIDSVEKALEKGSL